MNRYQGYHDNKKMMMSFLRCLHEVLCPGVDVTFLTMLWGVLSRSCAQLLKTVISALSNPTVRPRSLYVLHLEE